MQLKMAYPLKDNFKGNIRRYPFNVRDSCWSSKNYKIRKQGVYVSASRRAAAAQPLKDN